MALGFHTRKKPRIQEALLDVFAARKRVLEHLVMVMAGEPLVD